MTIKYYVLLIVSLFFLTSCSSEDKNVDSAEKAFNAAAEIDKAERYEEALKRYQEVRNKYPYSKFAVESQLAIADVYYKQESFADAQQAYQNFRDLNPKHSKIDYVNFQLAMSYFKQLPETIDRDLTLAPSAISLFDEFLKKYPNSQYAAEAKKNREASFKMLAEKEDYIANYYFIRDQFESALARYEAVLKKYSDQGFESLALSRAAVSAFKIGQKDKAQKYFAALSKKYPNSDDYSFAEKEMKK